MPYHVKNLKSILIKLMACHLLVPSHHLYQCPDIVNWTLGNTFWCNFYYIWKCHLQKWWPFFPGLNTKQAYLTSVVVLPMEPTGRRELMGGILGRSVSKLGGGKNGGKTGFRVPSSRAGALIPWRKANIYKFSWHEWGQIDCCIVQYVFLIMRLCTQYNYANKCICLYLFKMNSNIMNELRYFSRALSHGDLSKQIQTSLTNSLLDWPMCRRAHSS